MAEPRIIARLEPSALDAKSELAAITAAAAGDGAVVSFVGLTRDGAADGHNIVQHLFLEHHPILSERSLFEIADAALRRFDVSRVRVVHRSGEVAHGHPIVFAGASAKHRRAAFEAVDYLMDRLKTDAVLWKREEGPQVRRWIEPTDDDHIARARWSG